MRARGQEFLTIPDTYYEELREQLKHSKVKIEEDLNVLQVRLPTSCQTSVPIPTSCQTSGPA